MNSDGAGIVKVKSVPCVGGCSPPHAPDWSPDGRIVFTTKHLDGNLEIYAMNLDRTNLTNLTNHPADDAMPAGSPDGSKIAFASKRSGRWEIYLMNADGTGEVNLTKKPPQSEFQPAWRP